MIKNTHLFVSTLIASLFLSTTSSILACTDILVTPGASTDGSMILAHTDDNELSDQRILYVPAADHKPGSMRAVYPYLDSYPRYAGSDRGPGYELKGYNATKPLGYIKQVPHTYAYFDAEYPIINEHQLSFAEGTMAAKVSIKPQKGKAIFDISALMRVALERCKTAVCAVKTMGDLAVQYGYYGDGESVLIGDTKQAWEFEITGTPLGTSAIWAAEKIPDGTVAATANLFIIRDIKPGNPNILYSKNLFSITKKAGWWNGKMPFDWLSVVSPGEYLHPYYSLRRVWRIYSRIKPSGNFSPWVKDGFTQAYPFSIKPDKKLSVRDVFSLLRDHYEGTPFDTRVGIAAGAFGSPERYYGDYDNLKGDLTKGIDTKKIVGAWERPISVYYTGYSTVNQSRGWLPDAIGGIIWLGLDRSYTNVYMPFYVGVTDLPLSIQLCDPKEFDFRSAWWAFNFVSNWATLRYDAMVKDIQEEQAKLENDMFKNQPIVEKEVLALYKKDPKLARQYLTHYCKLNADQVVQSWWALAKKLVSKYNKGLINGKMVGYSKQWLNQAGYAKGPKKY
ncbi:MAG: C69 family dipeptidase [Gammaproteobacteria bacterium]|nr:C69 family dipeptidase [Gammaproteobacteria bacterium]